MNASTVSCGCVVTVAMPNIWLLSVDIRSGRLSAVPAQDAMKVGVNEGLG